MNPYFFGPSDRPLFGAFHPSASASGRAALLCYPIAQEYMRSHWAVRTLARQLADAGLHVLRFDYSGTGDSAGAASVAQWRRDLDLAARELRDVSGARKLSVIGIRFGAVLATTAAVALDAERVILWDPVESGRTYLDRLEAMHRAMLEDPMRFRWPRASRPGQLLGFAFPDPLRAEIAAVDLCRDVPDVPSIGIVSSVDGSGRALATALLRSGRGCDHRTVADTCDWTSVTNLEEQLLAPRVLEAICHLAAP